MYCRRLRTIAIKTFKIIPKQNQSYLHGLFPYNVAQIWNELPNHFKQET
jgi:hypothetical protein